MIWKKQRQEPYLAGQLADRVAEVVHGSWGSVRRLLDVLEQIDATADEELTASTLRLLAAAPQTVVRLDEYARREWWGRRRNSPMGPVGQALASTHRDGRWRELAVQQILAAPVPALVPFLVLRTSDWVKQVRDRARAGLALLLADDPAAVLPAALPMALLVEARQRGGFARAQLLAALIAAPQRVRDELTNLPGRAERRFIFDVGRTQGWWHLTQLVAFAEKDDDVRLRAQAAEAACREAVWTRRPDVLHRLAASARAEVRAIALTRLVRVGQDGHVSGYLSDSASLIRTGTRCRSAYGR